MNEVIHCETPLIVTTKVENVLKVFQYVSIIKSKMQNFKYYSFTHDSRTKVINKSFIIQYFRTSIKRVCEIKFKDIIYQFKD